MKNLWRALALAWLGGAGSPALTDEPPAIEIAEERPAAGAVQAGRLSGGGEGPWTADAPRPRQGRPTTDE